MAVIKRDYERLNIKPYAPRVGPAPIPDAGIFDAPLRCLSVNAEWASHVIGVLQALDQGDTWLGDETAIYAARQQIRELIESFTAANCTDCEDTPSEQKQHQEALERAFEDGYSAGSGDCGDCDDCGDCGQECEEMSGCCIDKIEFRDGVLWYRKCGEWFATLGGMEIPTLPTDEDPSYEETEDPETQTDWRCAKAHVVAELCYLMIGSVMENYTLELWPSVYGQICQDMGFNPSQAWTLAACALPMADDLIPGSFDDIENPERKSRFLCNLLDRLDGSNNDIGENQMTIIEDELVAVAPANYSARTFSAFIVRAIGRENMRSATRHAIQTAYTCEECEPAPVSLIPSDVSYEWAHYYQFGTDDYDWTAQGTNCVWTTGSGFVATPASYGDRLAGCYKNLPTPAAEGFDFTFLWVKFTAWPTPAEGAVTYWFKLGADIIYSDPSLWGLPIVQVRTNKHVTQGQPVEISWPSTLGNPPAGTHVLAELLICGINNDPWPDDPDYIPT